jgi:hypothetical protein
MPNIRLTSFERVVPRGTQRVDWLVRVDGHWRNVADAPLATQLDSGNRGSGLIWQRLVEISAATGTWFQRIVTEPANTAARDPLSYLQREARGASRRVQRTYRCLLDDGSLNNASTEEPPV